MQFLFLTPVLPKSMNKLILFFLLMPFVVFSQHKRDPCPSVMDSLTHKLTYTFGEQLPQPKIGVAKLSALILNKFKYPGKDIEGGRVHLKFVVQTNGKLGSLIVLKGPSGEKNLFGKPIFSIVKKEKWIPGTCNGKKVPMYYDLMISCIMPGED